MLTVINTASGSVYEIVSNENGMKMRRMNLNAKLRKDGEWIDVLGYSPPVVGKPMQFVLQKISDDENVVTVRTTTTVTEVQYV